MAGKATVMLAGAIILILVHSSVAQYYRYRQAAPSPQPSAQMPMRRMGSQMNGQMGGQTGGMMGSQMNGQMGGMMGGQMSGGQAMASAARHFGLFRFPYGRFPGRFPGQAPAPAPTTSAPATTTTAARPTPPALVLPDSTSTKNFTCSDLKCKQGECCIETHRKAICVTLTTDSVTGERQCTRWKKCTTNRECPAGTCCSIAIDYTTTWTCPKVHFTSAITRKQHQFEGYCQPAVGSMQPCYVASPGMETSTCPCTETNERCVPLMDPFPLGLCREPTD